MNAIVTESRQPATGRRPGVLPAWRTNRIFSYIEKNLSSQIDLAELGDLVGLSPARLSRLFKWRYGLGLRFYVLCRRVVMAQNLMLMTHDPLKDIALQCGMSDQSHFTRVFHALVGTAPGRWRDLQREACDKGELSLPMDTTSSLLRRRDPMEATIDWRALQASLNCARELHRGHAPGETRCRTSDFRST